ncbi:MAG: hypothetical protein AAF441_13395 [Pseudomonadota bacterium]
MTFRLFGLMRWSCVAEANRTFNLLEWDNHSCHPDCLTFASDAILSGTIKAPYIFKVFCLGWLLERHETADSAARRIAELRELAKTTAFPGSSFIASDQDADLAKGHLQAVRHGRCHSRIVVSKLTADGANPIVHVGENSLLSFVKGKERLGEQNYRLNDRFRHTDKHLVKTLESALGNGQPHLQEVAMLVPARKDTEAWWLRMHRLCIPQRGNRIISYCIQGEIVPGLRSAVFGRPGPAIPAWTSV